MPSIFVLRCCPIIGFALNARIGTLGRSPLCNFFVNHPSISRRHATLEVRGLKLLVTDLDSRTGTFVNDRPTKTGHVSPGQIVRFGEVPFTVDIQEIRENDENDENDEQDEGNSNPTSSKSLLHEDGGEPFEQLSKAHRRVFELLLTGAAEKTIAQRLELSHHTVHNHVRAIFRIFGVHSRAELLERCMRPKCFQCFLLGSQDLHRPGL